MNVSIAIPTYNRAGEVEKTLAGLTRLDTAGSPEYEVLVIDNNSSDETAAVVARMMSQFAGRLRYVREERQGLNHARNRAIVEAKYGIVAYLDDDVNVDPQWLKHLSDAFASGDVAAVGGRAYLVFPVPRPRWLGEPIEGLLTRVELGPERRPAQAGEIFGVNLSFRKDWLVRTGGFRPDLDRMGTCLLSGGDDEMVARVAEHGGQILYDPGAVVGHRVPLTRLTRKWFRNRSFWGSVGNARVLPDDQVCGYEFLRATWHLFLFSWRTIKAGLRHGVRSAACFQQLLKLTSRAGLWFGLAGELRRRGGFWGRAPSSRQCPAGAASS